MVSQQAQNGSRGVAGHSHDEQHDQLDTDILEGVFELIGRIMALGENMAQRLCIPSFFIKALHTLERPMAMKDLGKRMHCDPSFVTTVADMLEKRGLARREAHPGDRRVKNLVLTGSGRNLRHCIETEMAARMPWSRVLTCEERRQFLALIRKMLTAQDLPPASLSPATLLAAELTHAGLPGTGIPDTAGADSPVFPAAADTHPPAPAGEVNDTLSAHPASVG
jgi:MarR family transcriptional regulator, organic hydroperoxide resistance regulator